MLDIVILTDQRYVNPKKTDWYINQVLLEDQLLYNSLIKLGLKVDRKNWADNNFDWSKTKYAIFRTTWDYFDRLNEFISWLEITKSKTKFINSFDIIQWNIDKHYLKDLSNKGINIAPTLFIKKNEQITLSKLFKKTQWNDVVIKPAISGAARLTYRINDKNHIDKEKEFKNILKNESMLFQQFLGSIITKGEISLILIGGEYTHAVIKNVKQGDFRVQDDHGGTVNKYCANKKEIQFAEKCLSTLSCNPIYARVDIVYDNNKQISLSELELIEPELWFRNYPAAATKLAQEIKLRFF